MSQNKAKRLESKKKKAAAFLDLIKSDTDYENSKTKTEKGIPSSSTSNSYSKDKMNSSSTRSLSDEMLDEYKKIMRERQKASMQRPKVFLTLDELALDDPVQTDNTKLKVPPPLFMADIQHLLLYALQGQQASIKPRWCRLLRYGKVSKVVAVVLDSLSSEEFKKYPESLPTLSQAFDLKAEFISPAQYGSSARADIMNVPISISQIKKKNLQEQQKPGHQKVKEVVKKVNSKLSHKKWSVLKTLKICTENPLKRKIEEDDIEAVEAKRSRLQLPDEFNYSDVVSTYDMDKFDRRWLLLNSAQMLCEGIPSPVNIDDARYHGYMFSKNSYKQVTAQSPMFAVDCEMVQTSESKMDLARVSIIDENLDIVLDMFVKPRARVTNYVTQFSGITKDILDPVKTRLSDVQRILQENLPPDAILCGQSICNDLASMKVFHPYIIDTSVIYNLTGYRGRKTGLKRLTSIFLRRGIQESDLGHSSVEDAQATMELVLLKLRNSMEFGDLMMSASNDFETIDKSACVDSTELTDSNDDSAESKGSNTETKAEDVKNEPNCENESSSYSKCSNNSLELASSSSTTAPSNSDDKSESSTVTRTIVSVDCDRKDIQRRKLFFQGEGGKFIENFLKRIDMQKRKGTVVDHSDNVKLYPDTLSVSASCNDKESEKQTLDSMKEGSFCFTHLYGYKNYLSKKTKDSDEDEENIKSVLWKLDRRFWKIMMGLPSCSLFVVILPGRDDAGSIHSAMAFAKIT